MGREWSEKRIIGSVNKTISTQYNLDGSVKQITYPSGTVLTYSYDSAAELTQVKDTTHNIIYFQNASYFPTGQLNQATYGSVVETSIYDNRLQPCWYYATTGTPLAANTACSGTASMANVLDLKYNFGFGTNDNGNVLNLTNDKDSNRSVAYTYDALNRIASALTPNADCSSLPSGITKNWGETFTIDPWGNLTNRTATKCSVDGLSVVALNNNRLSGFGYDADGNMTSNGGASYTYTAESRLKTAGGVTYTYNGDGERVKKSNGTLYWGSGPLLESDLSGNLQREFIFANGKRIARRDISGGTVYYYFADQLGSADVVTNSSGTIQNESDYFPYGGERVYSQTLANQNYKFTGKERDAESGLDNFGARYDASSLGRFMTPDWDLKPVTVPYATFGDPQSLNLYAYVENAPVNRVDADGHGCDNPVGGNSTTDVGTTGQSCEELNHTPANTNNALANQTTLTEAQAQNQLAVTFDMNAPTEPVPGASPKAIEKDAAFGITYVDQKGNAVDPLPNEGHTITMTEKVDTSRTTKPLPDTCHPCTAKTRGTEAVNRVDAMRVSGKRTVVLDKRFQVDHKDARIYDSNTHTLHDFIHEEGSVKGGINLTYGDDPP